MATLIRRLQSAILGSGTPDEIQALLAELGISPGGSGQHALRHIRRGILYSISDEAFLRDAFSNLGVSGGGGGGQQAVWDIRNAILLNLRDSEATLRHGLDNLLTLEDLGGDGGGPGWVPANAKIHIDFLGGTPQGRAWSDGAEVAINTLLGNDPNTEAGWDVSAYNPADITADGFCNAASDVTAFIGAARTLLLDSVTFTMRFKDNDTISQRTNEFALLSADGNDAVEIDLLHEDFNYLSCYSWSGSASIHLEENVTSTNGAINVVAVTIAGSRFEAAVNGSEVLTTVLTDADRPAANPLVAVIINLAALKYLQSITIYDPLPTTAGLSELSAAT